MSLTLIRHRSHKKTTPIPGRADTAHGAGPDPAKQGRAGEHRQLSAPAALVPHLRLSFAWSPYSARHQVQPVGARWRPAAQRSVRAVEKSEERSMKGVVSGGRGSWSCNPVDHSHTSPIMSPPLEARVRGVRRLQVECRGRAGDAWR